MKIRILLILFLSASLNVFSQQVQVSGTVLSSEDNLPIVGANVLLKGQNAGTSTDFDGNYSLTANAGDVLLFSYIGFETQQVVLNDQKSIQIVLSPNTSTLDEIVVIGYGTQKKKEITGAVSVIGSETIEKLNPTRVEQALQGQVAGVNITSTSGAPGANANIRIRGISTNGNSSPLILVDGNPIGNLAALNPNDIKSVNVLKDATAGIYGVRAANGVILIETKSGSQNRDLKVEVDTYYAFQETTKKIDVLNASQFAQYVNDATGESKFFIQPSTGLIYETGGSDEPIRTDTDWQNSVFETAPMYNANINLSGGTEDVAYSFGTSYLSQDGIIGGSKSNFNRLTARMNLKYNLTDDIKITATAIYTHEEKNSLPENGIGAVLYNAINADPLSPVYDNSRRNDGYDDIRYGFGTVRTSAIEVFNPNAQIANTHNRAVVDKISPTIGVDYTFLDHFTVSSKFRLNQAIVRSEVFQPLVYFGGGKSPNRLNRNSFSQNRDRYDDYTWDNYLTYNNTFNENHNFTILLATSIWREKGQFAGMSAEDLYIDDIPVSSFDGADFANANQPIIPRFQPNQIEQGNDIFENRLASVFSRVQYNYKQKYLFSGVVRRDASSRFGPENSVGYFPSVSVGWNVSEETFLKDNSFINSFKLRGSYGIIGNDKIDDFAYVARLDGEGTYASNTELDETDLLIGVAEGKLSNPEIRWENQITGNIGFDLALLDNRIRISVDAFNKTTEDLLIRAEASGLTGVRGIGSSAPTINAGTVENKGIEVLVSYNDNLSEDFSFNTSFNFSTLQNEVTYVGSLAGFEEGGAFAIGSGILPSRMAPGQPIGYFHGYKTDGLYQSQEEIDALKDASPKGTYNTIIENETKNVGPGDLKFVDVNGDGKIDEDDRTYIGDPIPDVTMGLNLGFNYKNFDFSASAIASIGNDMVRDYERINTFANKSTRVLDAWSPTNTDGTQPRLSTGASLNTDFFSDHFVEDASFVRIQNIQLGYTFSQKAMDQLGVSKLRVYTSVNNLHTFTNYSGYDPSANSGAPIGGGIDRGFYPVAKTYMLGLNLSF
jgi:TonB-linked SusC/RagA family outer membrane protein